jgi:hypothetical protein
VHPNVSQALVPAGDQGGNCPREVGLTMHLQQCCPLLADPWTQQQIECDDMRDHQHRHIDDRDSIGVFWWYCYQAAGLVYPAGLIVGSPSSSISLRTNSSI